MSFQKLFVFLTLCVSQSSKGLSALKGGLLVLRYPLALITLAQHDPSVTMSAASEQARRKPLEVQMACNDEWCGGQPAGHPLLSLMQSMIGKSSVGSFRRMCCFSQPATPLLLDMLVAKARFVVRSGKLGAPPKSCNSRFEA